MLPTAAEILTRISEQTLLPPATIADLDHNAILDLRDDDAEFESQWQQSYQQIESQWLAADIAPEANKLKDDVRRESFMTVSRATNQHEIASYVSDDFDLIVRASILALDDPFINRLWVAYDRNEIPGS